MRRRRPASWLPRPSLPESPRTAWLWRLGVAVSLATSAVLFLVKSLGAPHGGWDAWMTWNVVARFLFRGGTHWQDAFAPSFRHPDYPLLLPGAVASLWAYVGADTVVVPVAVAMLFTFATVGLAGAALGVLRTDRQGVLGCLVLLGTPFLITHGASQFADVPLAFFFLATIVLIFLHDRAGQDRGLMMLAGTAAGFATWTKNEGVLFLAAVVIARSVIVSVQHGGRKYLSEFRRFALGLAPVLAALAYFKLRLAPPNDLVAGQGLSDTLARLSDVGRYLAVARVFKTEILHLADNGLMAGVPLLLVYLLCVGVKIDAVHRSAVATSLATLALVLGGYVIVLVTAPGDFLRLLNRSVDRLLLQLWPTVVFTYFMIVRPPDEATG